MNINIKTKSYIILVVMDILLGLLLVACGDSNNAATTVVTSTGTALAPTTVSELSPPPLPTFTPASTLAGGATPTLTPVSANGGAASLTDANTACGKIPYYVPPKLDANGKAIGPVYAAIGASDTVGTGSNMPRTDSWVVQLHNLMPQSYQFVRLGIGGITLHEANQCLLPKAIASQPSIISDWNVVNDIIRAATLDNYKTDLEYFLQQVTNQTNAKILLGNVPNLTTLPFVKQIAGNRYDLNQVTKDWNNLINQEAEKYKGRVYVVNTQADLEQVKQHPEWLSGDGLHPTTIGYTQLAQAFWSVITTNKLIQTASS